MSAKHYTGKNAITTSHSLTASFTLVTQFESNCYCEGVENATKKHLNLTKFTDMKNKSEHIVNQIKLSEALLLAPLFALGKRYLRPPSARLHNTMSSHCLHKCEWGVGYQSGACPMTLTFVMFFLSFCSYKHDCCFSN